MAIDNEQIAQLISQEIEHSIGGAAEGTTDDTPEALKYYKGLPKGTEKEGRSKVQSQAMADAVNAVLAEIVPTFTQETVIEFTPDSEEDEDQAQLESDFVADRIRANDGFIMINEACQDALVHRNCVVKCWVEEKRHKETLDFKDLTDVELQKEMDALAGAAIEEKNINVHDDGLIDITLAVTHYQRRLRFKSLAPEDFGYSTDFDQVNMRGRFTWERDLVTKSDLIQRGFDKETVLALTPYTVDVNQGKTSRSSQSQAGTLDSQQTATELVEVFICYVQLDMEEDGEASLYQVFYADQKVLDDPEPANYRPYAPGTALIMAHQFEGQSFYDLMKELEDQETATLRQYLDNMNQMNNRRMARDKNKASYNDLANSVPSGVVDCIGNPHEALMEIPLQDVGPSAQGLLEVINRKKNERVGSALDMESAEMQIAKGATAQGVDRIAGMKEKRTAFYIRTLAETMLRNVYLLTHETLRDKWSDTLQAKLRGKWAQTNPRDWLKRENVSIKVGLSYGEKQQQAMALGLTLELQQSLRDMGKDGELVNDNAVHNALMDWGRAVNLPNPIQYFPDPGSEEAQRARQGKQQSAQQQEAKMVQMQQMLLGMQLRADKDKQTMELQFKYWKETLDAAVEEMKQVGNATTELNKLKIQGDMNADKPDEGKADAA